jgi:hypothetical protein
LIPPEYRLRLLHWDGCLNVDPEGLPSDEAFAEIEQLRGGLGAA